MDLVLEVFDTYLLDKVYATLLPASATKAAANAAAAAVAASANNSTLSHLVGAAAEQSESYGIAPTTLVPPSVDAYASLLPRSSVLRQALSLFAITTVFGWLLYLSVAYLSYKFVYDMDNFKHPKMLKNQIRLELKQALTAIPVMTALTVPWFLLELQGYSKMYWDVSKYGTWYLVGQFPLFLVFTDCLIYMIHRGLHHPLIYKRLHKPHHKWIVPTPFASHAFHPVDGYLQSLPYHIFPFFFPLQKIAYVVLFMIVNVWTVMIHDGEYLANDPVVNGSACHTVHHLYFNYNYGQYTTLWDRLGGTYRLPDQELFDKSLKKTAATWSKQVTQMEEVLQDVEGDDDRVYVTGVETSTAAKRST